MALNHAQTMETIDLAAGLPAAGPAISTSLLKTGHLHLMRLVIAAKHGLPEHSVPGEVTIQCLSGLVHVRTPERQCQLASGQLVALAAGEPHAVIAECDATVLVTIVRPEA